MFNTDRLEGLIKERGLKKKDVFAKIGSRQKLYDWRAGNSNPSNADLEVLADMLNTTAGYLKGESDIKNKPTAETDDELLNLTNDPQIKTAFKIFQKLNSTNRDVALVHLEALAALQDKQENK